MDLYDWLLFLHVLSAFFAVGALTALWGLILGTRGTAPLLDQRSAMTYGRTAGILVGVGMMGTIIFGVWLAIHHDAYQVWDGWILASLVLWAIGGWAGGQAGRAFESGPGGRARGRDPLPDDQQRRRGDHPRAHDLEAGCLRCFAAIRPDSVNLPLFLHVLGAMLLVGTLLGVTLVTVLGWRSPDNAPGLRASA